MHHFFVEYVCKCGHVLTMNHGSKCVRSPLLCLKSFAMVFRGSGEDIASETPFISFYSQNLWNHPGYSWFFALVLDSVSFYSHTFGINLDIAGFQRRIMISQRASKNREGKSPRAIHRAPDVCLRQQRRTSTPAAVFSKV